MAEQVTMSEEELRERTRALLDEVAERPLYARVAKDNRASVRVLKKCGFATVGEDRFYSEPQGRHVDEFIFALAS